MIFPSYIFLLVFLPLVLAGWHLTRSLRIKLGLLTLASYAFYGWWDYRFVSLMVASTVLDYVCGWNIHKKKSPVERKIWLVLSLVGNLGSLGFFKYYDFFVDSLRDLLSAFSMDPSLPLLNVILPVGISFYTFQSMSYTIDIYRGKCEPTKDLLRFAAYVSMFPQLVAGPIVRYEHIEEQLTNLESRRTSLDQICDGVWLFVLGLGKKIWIADTLAPVAELAFDGTASPQLVTAWAGTLCYTFQLYFDFSGYSDMARGLGKMLGFEFPINFCSPYKSADISEFWNRWHITLSHWLRDYLYIPLGGSRKGTLKTFRNLGLTMLLGGLWHGAAWNFVVWGLYHGALLITHAGWQKLTRCRIPRIVAVPITFLCVMIGWALFRAESLGAAIDMLAGMGGFHGIEPMVFASQTLGLNFPAIYGQFGGMHGLALLGLIGTGVFLLPNSEELPKLRHPFVAVILATAVLRTIATFTTETPFLYFQF